MQGRYRPNVAGLLVNADGQVLICERKDFKNSWQFPQGGVDRNESLVGALNRELDEELGLEPRHYQILRQRGGFSYNFPNGSKALRTYLGQEQTYFLCKMLGSDADIRLDKHKPEFVSFKWIAPEDFQLSWLPEFKRPVYAAVLREFFGVGE
ncbi:MAG: NUDIX domain-containing protein [Verrucomicrobiales bacterium]